MVVGRPWGCAVLALLAIGFVSGPLRADDRAVDLAVIVYETGRYDECVRRFQALLKPGAEALSQDGRSRARMYLGACLVATRREAEADTLFEQLVREDYRFTPDRASFSPSVIGRFLETQLRLRDEIEAKIREEQIRQERLRQINEERLRLERERQQVIEQMAREQLSVQRNSRLVALIPFGVGQFQNRQNVVGWSLLGAEAAFAATSVVSYFLKQNIEQQFSLSTVDPREAVRLRNVAVQVNYIAFGAFVATALGGIVHAQITFVPEFREVRERPLPPPVPPLAPSVAPPTPLSAPVGGILMWQGHW